MAILGVDESFGSLYGAIPGSTNGMPDCFNQLQNQQGIAGTPYPFGFLSSNSAYGVALGQFSQVKLGYSERLREAVKRLKEGINQDLTYYYDWGG